MRSFFAVFTLIVLQASLVCCYTEIWRKPRNVMAGPSYFDDITKSELEIFQMQHDKTRACIETDGNTLKTGVCDDKNINQKFKFNPTAHNAGTIESLAFKKCVFVSGYTISLRSCSSVSNTNMVFTCYCPLSEKGGMWQDRDWVGLKLQHEKKCVSIQNDGEVKIKDCAEVKGDEEQKIIVKDRPGMSVCAKAGYLAERTNDTRYYYFKHPQFLLANFDRYVRVHMVYSYNIYKAFVTKYGVSNAMSKIYEHAQDTMGIVDKLYRKVRVRMLISGITVWTNGDQIPTATNSGDLHENFRKYINGVRQKLKDFDDAVYFFDGDMYGAAGTATSQFCRQNNWNEVFLIATLTGDARLETRHLGNTLTHEFAHQLDSYQHTWDPPHTCPTYHLFGGRCTLGGNDWPKGFSSNEVTKLRDNSYDCLKTLPQQSNIFQCGNGVIESGEECDCGNSQSCLTSNLCCDGRICKLKKNSECSNENCCNQQTCKWDRSSGTCQGHLTYLQGDFGVITTPTGLNKLNYRHWKITTSAGKKAVLFLTLTLFEFEEGCPFDYIKVYDGPSESSKLLGTFCRTLNHQKLEGSSNNLYVTYKSDSSHESQFKLTYSTQSNLKPDDNTVYLIKGQWGQCLSGVQLLIANGLCTEGFILTQSHHLKHTKTGKCVEPHKHYDRIYVGSRLHLSSDCTTQTGKFYPLESGHILNAMSGLCMHISSHASLEIDCRDPTTKVTFKKVNGVLPTSGPRIYGPKYVIRHFGGRCFTISGQGNLHLTSACTTQFYLTSDKKLYAVKEGKCLVPENGSDNSKIKLGSCEQAEAFFQRTADDSIQQIVSGKCMHPLNGYHNPSEGHEMVMYRGCSEDKLKFKFEQETLQPYLIRHSGGLCLAVSNSHNELYLTSSCTTKFYFASDGQIKTVVEEKCLKNIYSGNNSPIELTSCDESSADYQKTLYTHLPSGSINQLSSGRCFHPLNGYSNPAEGTAVVVYAGCDAYRLKFTFEKVTKDVVVTGSAHQNEEKFEESEDKASNFY